MLRRAVVWLALLDDDGAAADDAAALAAESICFFVACFVTCFADDAAAAGLDSDDRLERGSARGACGFSSPSSDSL